MLSLNSKRELGSAPLSVKVVNRFITIAFMHVAHCFRVQYGYISIYNICNLTQFDSEQITGCNSNFNFCAPRL